MSRLVQVHHYGKEIIDDVSRRVRAAVDSIATSIGASVRRGVPVGKTGEARRSVRKYMVSRHKTPGMSIAYVHLGGGRKNYYAIYFEHGSRRHRARWLVRKATQRHRRLARRKIASAVRKGIG